MISPTWPDRRAVVTGIGVISPIGNSKDEFWQSLCAGQSGISDCSLYGNLSGYAGAATTFTGRVQDFEPLDGPRKKSIRKALKLMNRETQMAVAAAQQAIEESRLASAGVDPERIGVCFGAGAGSMLPEDFLAAIQHCTDERNAFDFSRWGTEGIQQMEPLWLLKCLPNMPACQIAILNDFQGPNDSITQREVSANLAVAEARNLITDNDVDMVLAGATGTTILPMSMVHMLMETEVAQGGNLDPATVCRPFDRDRSGMVPGEGAAVIVLEELSSAVRRGVPIYGEVLGAGSFCVTRRNGKAHCVKALSKSIEHTLRQSRFAPEEIGHIHAHGLSTRRSDVDEATAIRKAFGRTTDELPIVAAKSYLGNAGAAGGALELVASLLALKHGRLFQTLNFDTPDDDCQLFPVTSNDVNAGRSFLNLSLVPRGHASCLLIGAVE